MPLAHQIIWLFVLAVPIACIAWTVTHEELFREVREFCANRSQNARSMLERKFFFVFTCEYCFSAYVTAFFLIITGFKLLYPDWRGYLVSFFALIWIANQYMTLYANVRVDLKKERFQAKKIEKEVQEKERELQESEKLIEKPAA